MYNSLGYSLRYTHTEVKCYLFTNGLTLLSGQVAIEVRGGRLAFPRCMCLECAPPPLLLLLLLPRNPPWARLWLCRQRWCGGVPAPTPLCRLVVDAQ